MEFVLDCSAAMAAVLADEDGAAASAVRVALEQDYPVAPALWPVEVANVLMLSVRRKRISDSFAIEALDRIMRWGVRIEAAPSKEEVRSLMELSGKLSLSLYDACYLGTSIRLAIPLATLDNAMVRAARQVGVGLILQE